MTFKDFFIKICRWISTAFSGSDNVSIKRICGSIIIFSVVIILFMVARKHVEISIWEKIEPFCKFLVYIASLYFGINAILDVAKMVKGPGGDPSG